MWFTVVVVAVVVVVTAVVVVVVTAAADVVVVAADVVVAVVVVVVVGVVVVIVVDVVDVDVVVVVLWPMCYICPGGSCPIPATDSTCPREETIKVLMKESKCHSLVKWTLSIGQAIDNNTSNRGLVLIQVCCNAFCDKIINQSCCCCFVFDIAQSSSFLF